MIHKNNPDLQGFQSLVNIGFWERGARPNFRSFSEKLPSSGPRAALRLSTSYAAQMNEWQKVGSRLEAANDRSWVVTD